MNGSRKFLARSISLLLLACAAPALHGQTFTWTPTAAGSSYDWNNAANWTPSTGFPDAAGATANLTNDIVGNQTIRLRKDITLGILNIGDSTLSGATPAASSFTLGNATGETFSLTFSSGSANTPAQINTGSIGTATNSLNGPVTLNSNLAVTLGGTDISNRPVLSLGGAFNTNGRTTTFTGGVSGQTQMNFSSTGDIVGNGTIVNSSNSAIGIVGAKSFTGTIVANKVTAAAANTGSFTLTSGSLVSAAEFVINGFLTNGNAQNGGVIHAGNNSAMAANPGQRFTTNRITLNGGTLSDGGQTLTAGLADSLLKDDVSTLDFNSGFSHVFMAVGGNSTGTVLNVTTLERSPGASVYLRGTGLATTGPKLLAANGSAFLRGAAGAEGTTTMSIIPWLGANNTNASTANPTGFGTYTPTGARALENAEYAAAITAGATANVSLGNFSALGASTTINSLRYSAGNVSDVGTGKTLTVASGGIFFTGGNSGIGNAGAATAGTLDFGTAEGVVWTNGTNSSIIGASITGSAGLSKAGTGTLVLAGANSFSGLTYVGGGTLQIGTGVVPGDLGLSLEIGVASGATLWVMNGGAIADTAKLTLEQFGLFSGKFSLAAGVNETIGSLFFGSTPAVAGTYGSTSSEAMFKDDTFFGGSGVLTVVPEPSTALSLLGGLGMLFGLRSRRR